MWLIADSILCASAAGWLVVRILCVSFAKVSCASCVTESHFISVNRLVVDHLFVLCPRTVLTASSWVDCSDFIIYFGAEAQTSAPYSSFEMNMPFASILSCFSLADLLRSFSMLSLVFSCLLIDCGPSIRNNRQLRLSSISIPSILTFFECSMSFGSACILISFRQAGFLVITISWVLSGFSSSMLFAMYSVTLLIALSRDCWRSIPLFSLTSTKLSSIYVMDFGACELSSCEIDIESWKLEIGNWKLEIGDSVNVWSSRKFETSVNVCSSRKFETSVNVCSSRKLETTVNVWNSRKLEASVNVWSSRKLDTSVNVWSSRKLF